MSWDYLFKNLVSIVIVIELLIYLLIMNSQTEVFKNYGEYLKKVLPIYSWYLEHNELTIVVPATHLKEVMFFLKNHHLCQYHVLTDLIGVDYPSRGHYRFDVIYQLLSVHYNSRLKVKVSISNNTTLPSIMDIYASANWAEREVYDMFGILFTNHKDLRRILTDYGFEGHPFRKDFPLTGFKEIRYDNAQARVVYNPVELDQQQRNI